MGPTLDFYFDFSSPFAYLASERVEEVADRTGALLTWRPMLLGAVFKAVSTPNVPLHAMSEAKRRMYLLDMFRWAEHWGIPLNFPSRFPMNTVQALRCLLVMSRAPLASVSSTAAGAEGIPAIAVAFAHAAFRAYWVEDLSLAEPEVLQRLVSGVGADPTEVLEATQSDAIKFALRQATGRALEAGVFGAPTFVVNREYLFWGQDRLGLVERCLNGWKPPA